MFWIQCLRNMQWMECRIMKGCCEAVNNREIDDISACVWLYKSCFRFQAIEEEGGNPDEIIVHLEITPKKTPRRTPKGKNVFWCWFCQNRFTNVHKTCLNLIIWKKKKVHIIILLFIFPPLYRKETRRTWWAWRLHPWGGLCWWPGASSYNAVDGYDSSNWVGLFCIGLS